MKVYIPLWNAEMAEDENPFVYAYAKPMEKCHPNVFFECDKNVFWSDECLNFDIIHLMWPQLFCLWKSSDGLSFRQRLMQLKQHGVRVVSTCHNLVPHSGLPDEVESYQDAYELTDVFIHLGTYSKQLFEQRYPQAKHYLVLHHVYDIIYKSCYCHEESAKHLKLCSFWKSYVLCFGTVRNQLERDFIKQLSRVLIHDRIAILAPMYKKKPVWAWKSSNIKSVLKWYMLKIIYPNLVMTGEYINDEELPYYFGVSSCVLIARPHILNSGNVPMGLWMGRPVAGPNVGNIGPWLREIGNPTFNPDDISDVVRATKAAIDDKELGMRNREYAEKYLLSESIAEQIYKVYSSLISQNELKIDDKNVNAHPTSK
ncbi:MAG: hypothetical protein Q4F69_00050 [Bacteroidia bacterium]|nr:hypothetical protein [Bacteroidia bacterium]